MWMDEFFILHSVSPHTLMVTTGLDRQWFDWRMKMFC